jgi:exopolysaccharide biosynthesis polyprenyl glycosylphosphotransferase
VIWVVVSTIFFYLRANDFGSPKTILALTAVFGFGLITLWRYLHNRYLSKELWKQQVVFAGWTKETEELVRLILREPERGYAVSGIVLAAGESLPAELSSLPTFKNFKEFTQTGRPVHLMVVAPELTNDQELASSLYTALFNQLTVLNLEKLYEELMGRIPPFVFSETFFLKNLNEQQKKIYDRSKIIVDYLFAGCLALVFGLTFPFVALAIKLESSGPLFYIHERVGRGGKKFRMYKYRTMKALRADGSAEESGPQFAAVNDNRVTGVGKLLRRTRLDELPQFINIFKNEMSLIGPRPERPEFVSQLTAAMPFYALRHLIKPGLTGWAQIHESYFGTLEENLRKLEYDLYYIKNRGPLLDFAIILRTINIVLRMIGR